jgi:quercetin dioxygenase-like cupin family protein
MQYVRSFDPLQTVDTGFPGYRAQFLSRLESALMIASHIDEGGCGPGLHYHHSDQMYYLLEGSMNVQLGHQIHRIDAGTFVFIPAGLAHRNWNDGPGPETHFEMIIPAPAPTAPIALMVDSPDDVPAADRTDHTGYTQSVDPGRLTPAMPGLRLLTMTGPRLGCSNAVVNYMELEPGSAGPNTHIHDFDQYYLVLEGELTVEVALQTHTVTPHTLVLLPAGVPHRQYNSSTTTTEKHLAVLAPPPQPGKPWDHGVDFRRNGDDIAGPQAILEAPTAGAH